MTIQHFKSLIFICLQVCNYFSCSFQLIDCFTTVFIVLRMPCYLKLNFIFQKSHHEDHGLLFMLFRSLQMK